MRKHIFTPDQEQKIKANYLTMSSRKLADYCGCNRGVIQRYLRNHGLKVPKDVIEKFRVEALKGKTTFTEKEDLFIKQNYLLIPIKTLADKIGRSGTGVSGRMKQLGLKVPKEIREQRKKDSQFKKGNVPVTKGRKQHEYMSPEAIERTKATRFKKGELPHNTLPIGKEVKRRDKTGRVYILVKVSHKKKLQLKQRVVWERHHGKIPIKHNIVFKDGNTQNTSIENLECISDAELMSRNTMHNYPQDIKDLIHLKAAINRQINKHNNT